MGVIDPQRSTLRSDPAWDGSFRGYRGNGRQPARIVATSGRHNARVRLGKFLLVLFAGARGERTLSLPVIC